MQKRIGVILSGCGVKDGAEIHEAVITLLTLNRLKAEIICIAPDIEQFDTINHISGKSSQEKRNVAVEAARISRGELSILSDIAADDLDGAFLPGGFGVASNLCDFAIKGPECAVIEELDRLLIHLHEQEKPIGAVCIAPVILAKVFGSSNLEPVLTIGDDPGTSAALEKMGAVHKECPATECIVDQKNKLITAPAYMTARGIYEASIGIEKAVMKVLDLA